jgi:peptidyl-dipeptidase A
MMADPFIALIAVVLTISSLQYSTYAKDGLDEKSALAWVLSVEDELGDWCSKSTFASWNTGADITDENRAIQMQIGMEYAEYKKGLWNKVNTFPWKTYKNETLRRQLKLMSNIGSEALTVEEFLRFANITSEMASIYGKARVADYKDESILHPLTPDLEEILMKSTDADEQEYYWTQWRKASGAQIGPYYEEYVEHENSAAKVNGFANAFESWTSTYDSPGLKEEMMALWDEIEPLYLQLHAYVRRALMKQYPGKMARNGQIPAHLLGNMWGKGAPMLLQRIHLSYHAE